jgi:peptidoglycan hydrolase CwlO-like protein
MKLKHSIAWTALAVTLAAPTGVFAKTPAHHKAAAKGLSVSEQLQLAQQQLAQMQAQINTLNDKLAGLADQKVLADNTAAANAAAVKAQDTATKALATNTPISKGLARSDARPSEA